jgi:hypothetical protein
MRAIQRDVFAREAVGVPAAVPVLVTRSHEPADCAEQPSDLLEHLLALDRVRLDQRLGARGKISCPFSALAAPLGTKSMQIQIFADDDVLIDDLYVDPFLQRD